MKKIAITLLCFLLSSSLANARFFSMGPRIGVSILQVKVNPAQGNTTLAELQLEDNWGYHLGIFTRVDLFAFYVQPEILWTVSDAKFTKNNKVLKLGLTKLDMPIMAGLSFFRIVRAQIGPVFSLLLSAQKGEKDVKEHYSSTTIGWQMGLGFDAWNMAIDLKYEGHLSGFGDEIAGMHTNHGYALWVLSVGVNIL